MHDVASIVTTVNNNFDQAPSRTLSRENSNEMSSLEEGANNALVTQNHYPNLWMVHNYRQPGQFKTQLTESTVTQMRVTALRTESSAEDEAQSPRIILNQY